MSGATRLNSLSQMRTGYPILRTPATLAHPFTLFNNSLGAVGGGLQEEYGPMNADIRSNAAISGMWNIDYFHGDNRIVKEVVNGWQISPIVIFAQRRGVHHYHRSQQEL